MSKEWSNIAPEKRAIIERFQSEAPIKISHIARSLGLTVRAATLAPGISGEIRPDPASNDGFIIRVNRHDSAARQRFTVAHEIGHYLLHSDQIGRGISDDVLYRSSLSDQREAEANRVAADILMPSKLIERQMQVARESGVEDIAAFLADKFEVSIGAMNIKLEN